MISIIFRITLRLLVPDCSRTIIDNTAIGSEQAIWTDITWMLQTTRAEVGRSEFYPVGVGNALTGDLAQNDIIALEWCDYQSRPFLCGA